MEVLLRALRACAEPTRLRLLGLASRGAFCEVEFAEILGQSQSRLSRHLRLLVEAGMFERVREGTNVWFTIVPDSNLVSALLSRLPSDDAILRSDYRQASRVLADRARIASDRFRQKWPFWDEATALDLPLNSIEQTLLEISGPLSGNLLDIGTGTGRTLELLAPFIVRGIGIDASRTMVSLARTRLAQPSLTHCTVREGDMYRIPFASESFDVVIMQMVLHYADDPEVAMREAARVLRKSGKLILIDLFHHDRAELRKQMAHVSLGFGADFIDCLLGKIGLQVTRKASLKSTLSVGFWVASCDNSALASMSSVAECA